MPKSLVFCDDDAKIKECAQCGEMLPFEKFHLQKGGRGGVSSKCRACRCKQGKDQYKPRGAPRFCDTEKQIQACSRCAKILPFDCFFKQRKSKNGINPACKQCARADIKRQRAAKPHRYRNWKLKTKYGLTLERYEAMLETQGGLCLVCKNAMKKPVVDHNHTTGAVRGLLCHKCNTGIGFFDENVSYLAGAIEYINLTNKQG